MTSETWAILSIWITFTIACALMILAMRRHRRQPFDFAGWTIGLLAIYVVITILAIAAMNGYLNNR